MLLPKARSHIVAIFLIFCKNLRIFVFHVCVLNSACIICPALPLSCLSESHNAFSCILIRASLIVTGQDTVSHSPVSRNICILLCSVLGSCHQARWPKFKYEYYKINTQNIHTHRAEFLLIKATLTAEAWLCQERIWVMCTASTSSTNPSAADKTNWKIWELVKLIE